MECLTIEDKINYIFNSVQKTESAVGVQQARIEKLETSYEALSNEVLTLKNLVNVREQELRTCNIRISGFPLTLEEKMSDSKHLSERIYDRVLRPILTAAKANGLVEKVPTLLNTISNCYRIGNAATKPGKPNAPPVVVKLTSSVLKVAIMKSKKDSTPGPTDAEKTAGHRKVLIFEDLTPPAFKKLKELQEREEISKAWSIDGRLFLILQGSTNIVRVSSVFDDILTILNSAKPK